MLSKILPREISRLKKKRKFEFIGFLFPLSDNKHAIINNILKLAVCSLHENSEDDVDQSDPTDDHHQRTTSARPTTTTSTTTTKPSKPSTTPASNSFSHPTGYPQHYQPQPPFPQVHTSQSKSLYDDKNGGYHHQYIFHNGERNNNQQATSYQLFSNQGVSSTTVQPPQVHQIRFSSTSSPQIIHNNEPSTVTPLFHSTSSTIQTLLNSNGNGVINPIFHNHGIASTTEQFIHSNNPRETSHYREHGEQNIRPLEAIQSTNKGKVIDQEQIIRFLIISILPVYFLFFFSFFSDLKINDIACANVGVVTIGANEKQQPELPTAKNLGKLPSNTGNR